MGKAAKAHRAKVAKRNANMKQQEKKMQKLWQEAFEEQMKAMKEKFVSMSGDTNISGFTDLNLNEDDFLSPNNELENIIKEDTKDLMKSFEEELKNNIDFNELKELIKNEKKSELEDTFKLLQNEIGDDEYGEVKEQIDQILNSFNENSDDKDKQETTQEESEPTEPIQGE